MPNLSSAIYVRLEIMRTSLKIREKSARKAGHEYRRKMYRFAHLAIKTLANFHFSHFCSRDTQEYLMEISQGYMGDNWIPKE